MGYRTSTTREDFKWESFKCRICNASFTSPSELRDHRMNAHKGHMLKTNRR